MRTLLRFLFSAIGLLVATKFVRGLEASSFVELLGVAVLLGLLNATLGSMMKFLAIVPVLISFGCFSLVINGLVFWLAGTVSTKLGLHFHVSGFWAGFFGALITSFVAWLLEAVLVGQDRRGGGHGPRRIKVVND